jgi:hypothetical protein
LALAVALVVFQSQKSQNSLCVQVASHIPKDTEIYAIGQDIELEEIAFLTVSVPI